jgi:uncharacterized membrane protein
MMKQRLDSRVMKHTIKVLPIFMFDLRANARLTFRCHHKFTIITIVTNIFVCQQKQMVFVANTFKTWYSNWGHILTYLILNNRMQIRYNEVKNILEKDYMSFLPTCFFHMDEILEQLFLRFVIIHAYSCPNTWHVFLSINF